MDISRNWQDRTVIDTMLDDLDTWAIVGPVVAGLGAVVLLGIGILSAVKRTRPKDPPPHVSSGRRADDV